MKDEETAFLIDTYTEIHDALDVVAATYREHGESAEGWRLLRSTPSGESAVPIAHGVDLVYLARGELHDDYPLMALDRFVLGDDKPDSFIATGILAINHGGSIPAPLVPERIPGLSSVTYVAAPVLWRSESVHDGGVLCGG
jgi:hypothetical protein